MWKPFLPKNRCGNRVKRIKMKRKTPADHTMTAYAFRSDGGSARLRLLFLCALLLAASAFGWFVVHELRTSRLQARVFYSLARKLTYWVEPGPSPSIRFPDPGGPYDERLGYSLLPSIAEKLSAKGFRVRLQARFSPELLEYANLGLFPAYHEKAQAGLEVLDRERNILVKYSYPERAFPSFESIPESVVKTLLFIENRELLHPREPRRNPAVEWDRLFLSVLEAGRQIFIDQDQRLPGASTLATQIEKFRHSPRGLTSSIPEKGRQMLSASVRSYLDGEETWETRRRIVLDYVNSVPLAAIPGYGEVNGLGDGLWAWYGRELDAIRPLLEDNRPSIESASGPDPAQVYKETLSLLLAQRRPSFYLLEDPRALNDLADSYLRLLEQGGVLPPEFARAAQTRKLSIRRSAPERPKGAFFERKAANAVRTRLASLLEFNRLYDLDRLDLVVKSTLDRATQEQVTRFLRGLHDPDKARAAGLFGFRLLDPAHFDDVVYSFTLYERSRGANLLRVQTDNLDQPFDINQGVKLELGSSAKLRALVTYLEVVSALHDQYAPLSRQELATAAVPPGDRLSRWAVDYLASAQDRSLSAMLNAAMERRYSADPGESFFTGGGLHTFSNFNEEDNFKVPSVREAFRNSINLAFIRLMRDIVRYYMYKVPGSTALLLKDSNDPVRQSYLARFADQEGRIFLRRFYGKYRDKSADEVLEILVQGIQPTPKRLAVIFRSAKPEAGPEAFVDFLRTLLPESVLSASEIQQIYFQHDPTRWSLADRGYIAHVHPLELWTVEYLREHPEATLEELLEASSGARQEVYRWLFKTKHDAARENRIRQIVEIEAFQEIHRSWKRLGYPFGSLVPSYATAIGSSADRPAALAELVGIILNNGVRYPLVNIEELHFAAGTPYETCFALEENAGEQVLRPAIAAVVRRALLDVVESGTAVRLAQSPFVRANGMRLAVGGKTGTGDNRYDVFGSGAVLLESRVVNRTATFAFLIGERFFGVITAYVPKPYAANYSFTSSLPVQILKAMAPMLMPLLERAEAEPAPPSHPKQPVPAS